MNTIKLTLEPTQDDGVKQLNIIINGVSYPANVSLPVFNRLVTDEVVLEVIDETISHATPTYNTVIEE